MAREARNAIVTGTVFLLLAIGIGFLETHASRIAALLAGRQGEFWGSEEVWLRVVGVLGFVSVVVLAVVVVGGLVWLVVRELVELGTNRLKAAWSSRGCHEWRFRARLAALAVAAFMCFWFAAANEYDRPFDLTDGQWRLIGWSAIATAAITYWRRSGQKEP